MKYKKLGETGLLVSELSFGSWVISFTSSNMTTNKPFCNLIILLQVTFSEKGQVADVELAFDIMKTAYEGGVNFFDNVCFNSL